jgi:sugar lactone lactonase YvrE
MAIDRGGYMTMRSRFRAAPAALLLAAGLLAAPRPASATVLYATSITTGQIYSVDTTTHAVNPVLNTGQQLDSLFFDPSGRVIYSQLFNGRVLAYDPTTHANTTLASSGLGQPIDMALEPNLTSFLVSDSFSHIVRVSLAGGVLGSLNVGSRPDGITYGTAGDLFANISGGFQVNNSQVKRLDPTTGATLATTGNTGVFLDGLTYDSFTGFLYASDYNNGRIVKINPTTMSFSFLTPTGAALDQPDGITSDGQGHLYIASRANATVMEYNILTNADTAIATINGLDDLAPASGLGAAAPEPSTLGMALTGALVLGGYQVCRNRRAKGVRTGTQP